MKVSSDIAQCIVHCDANGEVQLFGELVTTHFRARDIPAERLQASGTIVNVDNI